MCTHLTAKPRDLRKGRRNRVVHFQTVGPANDRVRRDQTEARIRKERLTCKKGSSSARRGATKVNRTATAIDGSKIDGVGTAVSRIVVGAVSIKEPGGFHFSWLAVVMTK